jgi:hypothetical protein
MNKSNLLDIDKALIHILFETVTQRLNKIDKAASAQMAILKNKDALITYLSNPERNNCLVNIYIGQNSREMRKLTINTAVNPTNTLKRLSIIISNDWSSFEIVELQ